MRHETLTDKQNPVLTTEEYTDLSLMDVDNPTDEQKEMLERIGIVIGGPNVSITVIAPDGAARDILFNASVDDFGTNIVTAGHEVAATNSEYMPVVQEMGQEAVELTVSLDDEAAAMVRDSERQKADTALNEQIASAKRFLETAMDEDLQRAKVVELLVHDTKILNAEIKSAEQDAYAANYMHEQGVLVHKLEQFIEDTKKVLETINIGNDMGQEKTIATQLGDAHDALAATGDIESRHLQKAHDIGVSIIELSHKTIDCNNVYMMLRNLDQMTHDGQATVSDVQTAMRQILVRLEDMHIDTMQRATLKQQVAANIS